MRTVRAAICQNRPGNDKNANVRRAVEMIGEAARNGAHLVSLAEIFYYPYDVRGIKRIADEDERVLDPLREAAAKHAMYLCTGSVAVRKGRGFGNVAYLISPSGELVLEYAKTHLFDVGLDGMSFRESAFISPGAGIGVAHTGIGCIGLLICYDIRFPEAARKLALLGAEFVIVPAAFNAVTGPAHWHVMFRARAIENQVFVLAVSQARAEGSAYEAYGHSMIVDPWGNVLAEAGESECIVYADLDAGVLEDVRRRLPLLSQRRPELYDV
jgi:omega-amidase